MGAQDNRMRLDGGHGEKPTVGTLKNTLLLHHDILFWGVTHEADMGWSTTLIDILVEADAIPLPSYKALGPYTALGLIPCSELSLPTA